MANWSTQLVGLLILVVPLVAIQWNLAGATTGRRSKLLAPQNPRSRWRLEIYSNVDDISSALADLADVPFPVKRVRSVRAAQGGHDTQEETWALPRVELDVDVADPFADEALSGLLGVGHRLRFVTGNEAVVDTRPGRLRIRALRFA